jgi:hypothetical protein
MCTYTTRRVISDCCTCKIYPASLLLRFSWSVTETVLLSWMVFPSDPSDVYLYVCYSLNCCKLFSRLIGNSVNCFPALFRRTMLDDRSGKTRTTCKQHKHYKPKPQFYEWTCQCTLRLCFKQRQGTKTYCWWTRIIGFLRMKQKRVTPITYVLQPVILLPCSYPALQWVVDFPVSYWKCDNKQVVPLHSEAMLTLMHLVPTLIRLTAEGILWFPILLFHQLRWWCRIWLSWVQLQAPNVPSDNYSVDEEADWLWKSPLFQPSSWRYSQIPGVYVWVAYPTISFIFKPVLV